MPKDFHMPVSLVKGGLCVAMLVLASAAADAADSFTDEIAPLFIRRCLECHSGPSPEGGLRLNDAAGLTAGGESGPAVIPSAPEDSLLWQRVTSDEMPPEQSAWQCLYCHSQPASWLVYQCFVRPFHRRLTLPYDIKY